MKDKKKNIVFGQGMGKTRLSKSFIALLKKVK